VADLLYEALLDGDAALARGVVLWQYLGGTSLAGIFDGPVAAALHRLGELWRHDESGIYIEHRATDICLQSLHQLRGLLPPAGQGAPVAVGGACVDDVYLIPSLMVAIILTEIGYDAVNLGPETPLPILASAVERYRASLAWLSFSRYERSRPTDAEVISLAAQLRSAGVPLVMGGQALDARRFGGRPDINVVSSMAELAAFARGMLASA
jgi:hypothetical protein